MKQKINQTLLFLKDKKNFLILIYTFIISIFLSLQISFHSIHLTNIKNINICFTILCFCFLLFISSHFIYKPKKIYNFLYNHRYKIGFFLFIVLVLGKFHAASIGIWNETIQPNYDYSNEVLLSSTKAIRSDEWLVNTPIMLAQQLSNFAIENPFIRAVPTNIYLLSTATVVDLIEIARPLSLGFFIGREYGLSIWWFGRLFALFFTSFELIMILTKQNKKASLLGSLLISGSSVVQWFFASYITEIIIGGQLALICFYKVLTTKEIGKKLLWSLFLAIGVLDYCLILYPAHQIPFGYIYLIFAIYIFGSNKDKMRGNLKYMILPILLILTVLVRFFLLCKDGISSIGSTIYPGHRFVNGGSFQEWQRLLQYPYTLLLPFKDTADSCTISSFFSLFPLPFVLSIYYFIKKRKKTDKLILSLTVLAFIYFLFCIFPLPNFFVKYTLLSKTTVNAICAPLGFIFIYLLCLLWDKITLETKKEKIGAILLSILLSSCCVYISNQFMKDYLGIYGNILLIILFTFLNYGYLTKNNSKKENIIIITLSLFMTVNISYINPLTVGVDMIYKKPIASEISAIVEKESDSRWIALDSFTTPNYLMMNGAKTINSTNLYPNLEIWKKIDQNRKYEDIYNRYAHITIHLTKEKTKFQLMQPDLFTLELNPKDLSKLDVDYIYCNTEIPKDLELECEKIYEEDGSYIYKIIKQKR